MILICYLVDVRFRVCDNAGWEVLAVRLGEVVLFIERGVSDWGFCCSYKGRGLHTCDLAWLDLIQRGQSVL